MILRCNLHQSGTFNFVHGNKIPSSLVRLGGLGPSADTTAKRKRWAVSLLPPQQSERYLVKTQSIASMNNQNNFIGTY